MICFFNVVSSNLKTKSTNFYPFSGEARIQARGLLKNISTTGGNYFKECLFKEMRQVILELPLVAFNPCKFFNKFCSFKICTSCQLMNSLICYKQIMKLFKLLSKDRTMIMRVKKKMKKWISNLMRLMQLTQLLVVSEKWCSCTNLKK